MSVLRELPAREGEAWNASFLNTIAKHFWSWFEHNKKDVLLEKKVLGFFTVRIKLEDLRFLFERLFGPQPVGIL
jgi:hypothetical protein